MAAFYPAAAGFSSCQSDSKTKEVNEKQSAKQEFIGDNKADFLYYNPKTRVLHYPGLRKDKTDLSRFNKISVDQWERYVNEGAFFAKETSGTSFEKLALRNFGKNGSISKSLGITEKAFGKEYASHNRFNWRVYDLLLQWIALDETVSTLEKSARFNLAVQHVDLSAVRLPKRMAWMKTSQGVEQRAAYIFKQKTNYIDRLKKRTI